MLVDINSFYPSKIDEQNIVIKNDYPRKDIKIVNEQIWNFFFTKYGGGPCIAKRYFDEPQKGSMPSKWVPEIYYKEVFS